jgi:hypothetical protein
MKMRIEKCDMENLAASPLSIPPVPGSPLNCAFFRRIDLRLFYCRQRLVKKVTLEIVEEKVLRVRVGEVEAVVIDYLRLLLQPPGPAGLTDFGRDSLSEFVGKGRKTNRGPLLITVFTFDIFCHE